MECRSPAPRCTQPAQNEDTSGRGRGKRNFVFFFFFLELRFPGFFFFFLFLFPLQALEPLRGSLAIPVSLRSLVAWYNAPWSWQRCCACQVRRRWNHCGGRRNLSRKKWCITGRNLAHTVSNAPRFVLGPVHLLGRHRGKDQSPAP